MKITYGGGATSVAEIVKSSMKAAGCEVVDVGEVSLYPTHDDDLTAEVFGKDGKRIGCLNLLYPTFEKDKK